MEHIYSRDIIPSTGFNRLPTRKLMEHRPRQCAKCHKHPIDRSKNSDMANYPSVSYNEEAAKESMAECERIAMSVPNSNSDNENWENKVNKLGWTAGQEKLFSGIVRILDCDRLARLATSGIPHEPIQRRIIIDTSVQRVRRVLASISWDTSSTQWIHGILMNHLSPSYLAIYLDILQTMRPKIPSLVNRMVFEGPMTNNQDLLASALKERWDINISEKERKLPESVAIVMVNSPSALATTPRRIQKWYQLFLSMAHVYEINLNSSDSTVQNQTIEQVAEYLVSRTIMQIRNLQAESSHRKIILVGFNAGASAALQVALTENINSIVCMGFAYNTINGIRGTPDDHILKVKQPIMFVIGQNSIRTSEEEMEALRERMCSETTLLIVGSADDVLRIPKNKQKLESLTQSMVDNMIIDEIFDFLQRCIINPPGPRKPKNIARSVTSQRKRKLCHGSENIKIGKYPKSKSSSADMVNRIKEQPFQTSTPKSQFNTLPNQSPLDSYGTSKVGGRIQRTVTTALPTTQKIKMIPPNQVVQLKPPAQPNAQNIYNMEGGIRFIGAICSTAANPTATIKSGTKFITTKINQNQILRNPQELTVLKPCTTTTAATIDKNSNKSQETTQSSTASTDNSYENICDMPVLFADNNGNLYEMAPTIQIPQQSNEKPVIIEQNVSPSYRLSLNSGLPKPKHMGKYVSLSRSTLKRTEIDTEPGVLSCNNKVLVNLKSGKITKMINRPNIVTDPDKQTQQHQVQQQQQQIITTQKPNQNANVKITETVVETASAPIVDGTDVVSAIAAPSIMSPESSCDMDGSITTIIKPYEPNCI